MRLSDYFPESSISVIHSAKDWQEAIDFSMVSLLDKNYISENYIQAINLCRLFRTSAGAGGCNPLRQCKPNAVTD